jgi:integrase
MVPMLSQANKPGAFTRTKVSGIYFRLKANGSKTFYVRFTDSGGKRVYEACGSFEQAKRRLAEVTGKLSKGGAVRDTSRTVASLISDWEKVRQVKPRTAETQDSHVRLYIRKPLGRMKVRDVTRAVVLKCLAGLRRQDGSGVPLSDGTRAVVLATLSSILDLAVQDDLIAVSPCRALGRRQKPRQGKIEARILGAGELEGLLAACKWFKWLRPIVRTSLLGGLRLGEVCGLDWRDVDFERGVLIVRQSYGKDGRLGTPKGGVAAEIPLLPELRGLLAEHKLAAEDTSPDAPVFVTARGTRRRGAEVERAFSKARRYAGLSTEPRALRFHDLRHTSISLLVNGGASPAWVQRFARHANLATTLAYVHVVEGEEHVETAATALAGL